MKKIYLSGPVTGRDPREYMAHFCRVEEDLVKRAHAAGLEVAVVNPVKEVESLMEEGVQPSRVMCMRFCVAMLSSCDGIGALQGWEKSKGAGIELRIAGDLQIPIVYVEPPSDILPPFLNGEVFRYQLRRLEALQAEGFDEETAPVRAFIETIYRYLDPHGFEYISDREE